jgi:hypothetical protein
LARYLAPEASQLAQAVAWIFWPQQLERALGLPRPVAKRLLPQRLVGCSQASAIAAAFGAGFAQNFSSAQKVLQVPNPSPDTMSRIQAEA